MTEKSKKRNSLIINDKKSVLPGKSETKNALNPNQAKFCQLYVTSEFFGNGVEAYIEAYGIDVAKKGAYAAAAVSASRLLINANILKRINELLDNEGLNDAFVDKQLLLVLTQNADFGAKTAAIREYNKLKSRITEKTQLTIKKLGKDLEDENYV